MAGAKKTKSKSTVGKKVVKVRIFLSKQTKKVFPKARAKKASGPANEKTSGTRISINRPRPKPKI